MELRCEHKMFGRIIDPGADGVVEVKCSSRFCGAKPGVVVLHRFSTADGSLLDTKQYRDTPSLKGSARNGTR